MAGFLVVFVAATLLAVPQPNNLPAKPSSASLAHVHVHTHTHNNTSKPEQDEECRRAI
jgi:hypothetical protein